MDKEIRAILKNDKWELATLREGQRTIGVKWVYKLKKNAKEEFDIQSKISHQMIQSEIQY